MTFEIVVSTPEILSVITAYHGPCLSAVLILTLYVQIFRDNEDRVQELWACGRTASGWEGDRYAEELQEEMDAIERDRYEHQPFSGYSDLSPPFLIRDRERNSDSDES